MADKENSACATAAAPRRLTRAQAKRAAAVTAVAAKRKRVTLTELPALPNAAHDDDDYRAKPSRKQRLLEPEPKPKPRASPAPKPALPAADADAPDGEEGDPQLCAPYASDIYSYLRSMEAPQAKRRPSPDYIADVQVDVTPNMRSILVDWLVEVAEEFKLVSDTLYLTVSYIDRFLSDKALNRQRLQLLGVSAMLIASKYEEISPPNVEDFCYATDNNYSKQEMESDILNVLKFEMGNPTTNTFLRMFIRFAQEDNKKYHSLSLEFLGSYLAELSLLDYGLLRFSPSLIAASVVFVARLTLDPHTNPWSKKMQTLTGYKPSELKDCVTAIHELQLNRKCSSVMAIRDKYKQHRFKGVSASCVAAFCEELDAESQGSSCSVPREELDVESQGLSYELALCEELDAERQGSVVLRQKIEELKRKNEAINEVLAKTQRQYDELKKQQEANNRLLLRFLQTRNNFGISPQP